MSKLFVQEVLPHLIKYDFLDIQYTKHFTLKSFDTSFITIWYQGYLCDRCKRAMHKECISLLSKCGSSVPPALPPRPPSIQLPSSSGRYINR